MAQLVAQLAMPARIQQPTESTRTPRRDSQMPQSATRDMADWSAGLRYGDIPATAVERTKLQIMSVLGATAAGARSSKIARFRSAIERSSASAGPCSTFPDGRAGGLADVLLINAAASVVHDFDDYLFAGHTGHSAILATLAISEILADEGQDTTGEDFITAAVAANEAAGRLGASMLFGPHNGQMWSYIHLIGAAVAGSVLLGLDANETEYAIGMAFSQPNDPLVASFMGSDAKALIAAQPTVDGARGALFAAAGLKGARGILEDRGGFWARFHPDAMAKLMSGFGDAWVTDSLSYKIYPGCAYIDTAIDALIAVIGEVEKSLGRPIQSDDIDSVTAEAGFLTSGMETMSGWYRGAHISPMNVNFSVALSGSVTILAGRLSPAEFEPEFYLDREDEILDLAKKWRIENTAELNSAMSPKGHGFDIRDILRADDDALEGADFTKYEALFPAIVKVTTASGETFDERRDTPLGGAGRPMDETRELVATKFLNGLTPDLGVERSETLLDSIRNLEASEDATRTLAATQPSR